MERQMNNSNGRPKLELLLNKPVRVKLLKTKPFEGSSTYGSFLLYSVEHEGTEKAYFATDEVHTEIQQNLLKVGDEIILTKTAHQNGRKITPTIRVEVVERKVEQKTVASSANAETNSSTNDGLEKIMERSLREAVEITRTVQGVPFQNEDIQKIASCLFIARTKSIGFSV